MTDKIPVADSLVPTPNECSGTQEPDQAIDSNGHVYDITGPDRDAIVADLFNLHVDEFAQKWSSVRKGPDPATIETATIGDAKR
jgi:hypothetical protein